MFNIFKIDPLRGVVAELNLKGEFIFPAGEVSVKLNGENYRYKDIKLPNVIVARIQSSDDLIKLAMLKDALARVDDQPINLFLPYVPYARQDRVCDGGEAFSIAVLVHNIANLKFNKVTIVDPHSDATPAAFETAFKFTGGKLQIIKQLDVVNRFRELRETAVTMKLVSPDAGSNKKVSDEAAYFNHAEFIRADKLRDLTNGKIKEIKVYCDDLQGRDILIPDDICEKGGTFIGLAAELKKKNAGKIHLFVTHGVFGGTETVETIGKLLTGGIDCIWTTDSYQTGLDKLSYATFDKKLKVLDLVEAFYDKI